MVTSSVSERTQMCWYRDVINKVKPLEANGTLLTKTKISHVLSPTNTALAKRFVNKLIANGCLVEDSEHNIVGTIRMTYKVSHRDVLQQLEQNREYQGMLDMIQKNYHGGQFLELIN